VCVCACACACVCRHIPQTLIHVAHSFEEHTRQPSSRARRSVWGSLTYALKQPCITEEIIKKPIIQLRPDHRPGGPTKKKKRHRHRHRHLSVSMCTFVCVKQVNWAQEVIKEPKPPVIDGACGPNILILILAPPPHHRQYVHFCTRKASKVGVVRSHRANESASVERKALRFS
jgi:hypothetical protein